MEPTTMMADLPPFSKPRVVTNKVGNVHWHFKNGVPRDNIGDLHSTIVRIGDRKEYWMVGRLGGPGVGGVVFRKPYGDPYTDWEGVTIDVPQAKVIPAVPNSPSEENVDTYQIAQHPQTGAVVFVYGQKRDSIITGGCAISRLAVESRRPIFPANAEQLRRDAGHIMLAAEGAELGPAGSAWFGLDEWSMLVDEKNQLAEFYYEAETIENRDAFGQRWRSRIYRAQIPLGLFGYSTQMIPQRNPTRPVFAPEMHPRYGVTNATAVYGTANMTLRSNVSLCERDNSRHMLFLNSRPAVRKGGIPANGLINRATGLCHAYSHDNGFTWRWGNNNPLIDLDSLGWQDTGDAARLNSAWLLWDEDVVYLFFVGNEHGRVNDFGTRIYCCEARY